MGVVTIFSLDVALLCRLDGDFEDLVGLFCSHEQDEPILIQSDNATNAGVIEQANYAFSLFGGR